jgi:hypothetical protein
MTTSFVSAVKKCFRDAGVMGSDQGGQDRGHSFLVGYQGQLFRIEDNFQVVVTQGTFVALGSGENYALGAMFATPGVAPEERIYLALRAAASYNLTIREPFTLCSLPYSQDNHQHVRKSVLRGRKR